MKSIAADRSECIADWLLRAAVVIFALGLARALFTRVGTSLGSVALLHWEVPHSTILIAEKIGAAVVLVAALSLLIRPTVAALLVVAVPVFTEAIAGVKAGGFHFYELTPYAHALRYATPLALIPLIARAEFFGTPDARKQTSAWLLRLATATVFVIHGYEAWKLHPYFIDFVLAAAGGLFGLNIEESTAARILQIIAIVDFVVAGWLLVKPSWPLLGWLAFWGLVTALARPVTLGFASYPEVLLRASHVLAPLVIGLLVLGRKTSRHADANPEKRTLAEIAH
jgi:hypothetical protein